MLRLLMRRASVAPGRRFSSSAASASARSELHRQRRLQVFEEELQRRNQQLQNDTKSFVVSSPELQQQLNVSTLWRPVEALKVLAQQQAASASTSTSSAGQPADPAAPVIGVKVNGAIKGLGEPVGSYASSLAKPDGSLDLEFIRFGSKEGNRMFWHSGAHVVGAALEHHFGDAVLLTDGPAVLEAEGGFFYEMHLSDGSRISEELYPSLEAAAKKIVALKAPFERLFVDIDTAVRMFSDNRFKLDILARLPADADITVYRSGPFVDLCRGPHVPHTGLFRGFRLFRSSGSHWQSQKQPLDAASVSARSPALASLLLTGAAAQVPREGELLQRVYGTAFPTPAQLNAWQHQIDEAKARDHRVIGRAQSLFFFHDLSPGSAFMLPHGTRVYNRLTAMLRREYRARGYEEVRSPLVYKTALWKTSGHLEAYAENMFTVRQGMHDSAGDAAAAPAVAAAVPASAASPPASSCNHSSHQHGHQHRHDSQSESDEDIYGLKPMNCPGHCLIFAHRQYSYRELPVRLSDFSSLHRNEASGALGGLTRLRRFAQDDAHIFCGEEHIEAEVAGCLDFVSHIYGMFGFGFRMKLSTRPEKYVGDVATWDRAEAALGGALKSFLASRQANGSSEKDSSSISNVRSADDITLDIDEGGGAFYGPKVDVFVRDAIGREHQCATVQLDFQLPRRFGLSYKTAGGTEATPVIIHRAILGSLERMMGILIEHTAGRWPFFLSPRQILVCPVSERHVGYANRVAQELKFFRDQQRLPSDGGSAPVISDTEEGPPSSEIAMADTGLWVEIDDSNRTVSKKVREGQVARFNLIAVVGDGEEGAGTVALRCRDATTYHSLIKAWATLDAEAAAQAPKLPTASVDEAGSASKQTAAAKGKKVPNNAPAGDDATSAAASNFNSPLVTMSVPQLRSVCARMMAMHV